MRSNERSVVSLIGRIEGQPEAIRVPAGLRMDGDEVPYPVGPERRHVAGLDHSNRISRQHAGPPAPRRFEVGLECPGYESALIASVPHAWELSL